MFLTQLGRILIVSSFIGFSAQASFQTSCVIKEGVQQNGKFHEVNRGDSNCKIKNPSTDSSRCNFNTGIHFPSSSGTITSMRDEVGPYLEVNVTGVGIQQIRGTLGRDIYGEIELYQESSAVSFNKEKNGVVIVTCATLELP